MEESEFVGRIGARKGGEGKEKPCKDRGQEKMRYLQEFEHIDSNLLVNDGVPQMKGTLIMMDE